MVKIRKDRFQSNILIRATLDNFSEEGYLTANIDVQQAVTNHFIKSGYDHFINHASKSPGANAFRTLAGELLGILDAEIC